MSDVPTETIWRGETSMSWTSSGGTELISVVAPKKTSRSSCSLSSPRVELPRAAQSSFRNFALSCARLRAVASQECTVVSEDERRSLSRHSRDSCADCIEYAGGLESVEHRREQRHHLGAAAKCRLLRQDDHGAGRGGDDEHQHAHKVSKRER